MMKSHGNPGSLAWTNFMEHAMETSRMIVAKDTQRKN